jgi:hypothetical protein
MSAYPNAINPAAFPALPPLVAPRVRGISSALIARAPVDVRSALRPPDVLDAAVTRLAIERVADRAVHSPSYQNFNPGGNPPLPVALFAFLPGVDQVDIRWTVERLTRATKAKFELHSVLSALPIWTKEVNGAAAVDLLNGPDDSGTGPQDWAEVRVTTDALNFPAQLPNVHGAPYRLSLTVTGANGAVTSAWTYFDVQVQEVSLQWGGVPLIPAGAINDVLPVYQPLTSRDEQALVNGLRAGGVAINSLAPAEIALRSTNAAYVHLNEWYMWRDFGYLRFKARWGDGPRIPILARIVLRSLDHPAGVHSAAAARALGPAEFLWDWRDKSEADRTNEMNPWNATASSFVLRGLKYQENAAGEPPNCLNAHTDRGGKRGGPQRILPTFNSPATFPFAVNPAAVRTWGALSKPLDVGPYACFTGVIFQPSRMAKDTYELRVFLASGPHQATLDVAGTMDALVLAHPGLPTATTGMMEVVRQVDAQYVRKGLNTPRADLNAISAEYAKGGIKVVWTEPTWNSVQFNQCMADARNPNAVAEDANPVRNRIFQSNARARRNGLTAWHIANGDPRVHPVKAALTNYNQWDGSAAGGPGALVESAANFTLPGRDVIVNRYIEAQVQLYINKNRFSNDKLRSWNRLKAANPLVPDPELRITYFNTVLTQAQRNKILPAVRVAYEADGWTGWTTAANDREVWADQNFNYRISKLVYLAEEMHLRKVLADAFEGVTVFHYQHFFDTKDSTGALYARQCSIGGVAAISMNADLGLSGAFLVWDHPTNHQRQIMKRALCVARGVGPEGVDGHTGPHHPECTFKDGNSTIVHEFGHFLHLPHARPTGGHDEAAMHDQADAKCIMNYDPDALHLCGGCLLRLRGWAFFNSKGKVGFHNTNPQNNGIVPPAPTTAGLPNLFTNFYPDFV